MQKISVQMKWNNKTAYSKSISGRTKTQIQTTLFNFDLNSIFNLMYVSKASWCGTISKRKMLVLLLDGSSHFPKKTTPPFISKNGTLCYNFNEIKRLMLQLLPDTKCLWTIMLMTTMKGPYHYKTTSVFFFFCCQIKSQSYSF